MKRFLLLTILLYAAFTTPNLLAASFVLDQGASRIEFSVKHMRIAWVKGEFKKYSGSFDFDEKKKIVSNTKFEMKVKSIDTNHPYRDDELMLPKFLGEVQHPTVTFKQVNYKSFKDGKFSMLGDLTVKGVTKRVLLGGKFLGTKKKGGKNIIGFMAKTTITRKNFNLDWSILTADEETIIGEEIFIEIRVQGNEIAK